MGFEVGGGVNKLKTNSRIKLRKMKQISLLIIILTFLCQTVFSQNLPKEIMGSFAFKNNVYNYVYNQHSKSYQHSFKILKLENYDLEKEIGDFIEETEKIDKKNNFKIELDSIKNNLKVSKSGLSSLKKQGLKIQETINSLGKIDLKEILKFKKNINNGDTSITINNFKSKFDSLKLDSTKFTKKINTSILKLIKTPNKINFDSLILELDSTNFAISIEKIKDYKLKLSELNSKISNYNLNANSFNNYFNQFDIEMFEPVFISELVRNNLVKSKKDSTNEIKKLAYNIFYSIKTRLDFLDDEPITAYLFLKKKEISCEIHLKKDTINLVFPIQEVTIEFDNGTMKNIFVDILSEVGETIRFRNNLPITISGKFSTDILRDIKLYSTWGTSKSDHAYINLYDVIFYKILPSINSEDYSPSSTIVKLTNAAGENFAEIKKEKRSKILEFKTFSDFVGIDSDQPNGLIQMELSKKLNINSRHGRGLWPISFLEDLFPSLNNSIRNYSNHVFFPSIEFKGRISKIEENNDTLHIENIIEDKISYLKLNQHQTASFGFDLTYLRWNITELALDFQGNFGSSWIRTKIVDKENKIYPINSVIYKFGWQVGFHPDSRIGFNISYNWQKIEGLNKIFKSNRNLEWNRTNDTIKSYIFDVFFKTNLENKIFGRYSFNFLGGNVISENFVQVQIGYSTNIFANKK